MPLTSSSFLIDSSVQNSTAQNSADSSDDPSALNINSNSLVIERDAWQPNPMLVDQLLDAQEDVSQRWINIVKQIDQVLAGDLYSEDYSKSKRSFLNLSINQAWSEREGLETKFRIKTRIDLPHTKKRLRLLFDADDARDETLEGKILNKKTNELNAKETENDLFTTAALQWVIRSGEKFKESVSFGMRDFPKNPFVRFRSDFDFKLSESLAVNFDNSIYYAKEEKLFNKSALTFIKNLNADRVVVNRTQVYWQSDEDSIESSNITSYERILDSNRRYSYSAGVGHNNVQDEDNKTNYFLRGVYSHQLYEDWLFLDVTPVVEFPSVEGYSAQPALNIKLNVFLQ